jgi:uncharacterized protein YjiS (DUF1127 family)
MERSLSIPTSSNRPGVLARLSRMIAIYRQRRRLMVLDDRMLDDMGIDRKTANTEAARPIWDVPQNWRVR